MGHIWPTAAMSVIQVWGEIALTHNQDTCVYNCSWNCLSDSRHCSTSGGGVHSWYLFSVSFVALPSHQWRHRCTSLTGCFLSQRTAVFQFSRTTILEWNEDTQSNSAVRTYRPGSEELEHSRSFSVRCAHLIFLNTLTSVAPSSWTVNHCSVTSGCDGQVLGLRCSSFLAL